MAKKSQRVHRNKYEDYSVQAQSQGKQFWDCERKKAYTNKRKAEANGSWEVYKCPYCSRWHRFTPLEVRVKKLVKAINSKKGR